MGRRWRTLFICSLKDRNAPPCRNHARKCDEGECAIPPVRWETPDFTAMMNYVLGTVAGGLLVGLVTISAVRQPTVQARLGLFPVSSALMLPAARSAEAAPRGETPCRPTASVGQPDMLFSKRRFWFVAP